MSYEKIIFLYGIEETPLLLEFPSRGLIKSMPRIGPGRSNHATLEPMFSTSEVTSKIEKIVSPKPMLFCIVSAVPISSAGHAFADIAEN
jgi:hypothetical protein